MPHALHLAAATIPDPPLNLSFAPPVYITGWAEGFEKDFHRRAWTGKYAESFPAALEEADAVFRRNDAA